MSSVIQKFAIGDTVWFATCGTVQKEHPCPDCKGLKKWTVQSPAGTEYTVACPRCSGSYLADRALNLKYTVYEPVARRVTIGSVRTDTAADPDERVSYMCRETGVGIGAVYREKNLFATEFEAKVAAAADAEDRNKNVPWVVEQHKESLKFCDYELHVARDNANSDRQQRRIYRLEDLISDLRQCEDMSEIRDTFTNYDEGDAA